MSALSNSSHSRRLVAALFATSLGLCSFVPGLRAVTINSAVTNPNNSVLAGTYTEANPVFATFDFSSALSGFNVTGLGTLNFTLSVVGLQTANSGQANFGQITLSIDGFDTGIVLSGFGTSPHTGSFSSPVLLNEANIIAALNATPGTVTAGLIDANGPSSSSPDYESGNNGSVYFTFQNSSLQLSLTGASETPIAVPFTPVQSLGLILVAAALGFREAKRRGWLKPALVGLS